MSLIITIHTNEGILMASDSRTTFSRQDYNPLPDGKGTIITDRQAIHYSDTTYKTFLAPNNAGISTCGAASIGGKPLAGYIEDFLHEKITETTKISDMPDLIMTEFRSYVPIPDIIFHIAGYETGEKNNHFQKVFRVFIANGKIEEIDVQYQGAAWNGESEILARLINPYWMETVDKDGKKNYIEYKAPPIPWNFFSLQDAIDFATFAIHTTIETMRFEERPKTVGGPIDILTIKPSGATWVARKELHVN